VIAVNVEITAVAATKAGNLFHGNLYLARTSYSPAKHNSPGAALEGRKAPGGLLGNAGDPPIMWPSIVFAQRRTAPMG
jgi:hypothetical protein